MKKIIDIQYLAIDFNDKFREESLALIQNGWQPLHQPFEVKDFKSFVTIYHHYQTWVQYES